MTRISRQTILGLLLGSLIGSLASPSGAAPIVASDGFLGGVALARSGQWSGPRTTAVIATLDTTIFGDVLVDEVTTASIAPSRPAAVAPRASGVFGSVLFPISSLPASRHFKRVLATLTDCKGGFGCKPARTFLARLSSETAGLPFVERLSRVSLSVNAAVRYAPDIRNYRQRDHWAEVSEIVGRGRGDCEDYAILKMAALTAQGVPQDSMAIVVLFDHGNQAFHAVLSVATNRGTYILDNVRDDAYLDSDQPNYQPLYSLSKGRAWLHGVRKPTAVTVMRQVTDLSAVAPGEGVVEN